MSSLYTQDANAQLNSTFTGLAQKAAGTKETTAEPAASEGVVERNSGVDGTSVLRPLVRAYPKAKDALMLEHLILKPSRLARVSGARFESVYRQELIDIVLCKKEPLDVKHLMEVCYLFDIATQNPGGLKLMSSESPRLLPRIAACIQQVFDKHKEALASISHSVQGHVALHG